jgi:hypothetical protein
MPRDGYLVRRCRWVAGVVNYFRWTGACVASVLTTGLLSGCDLTAHSARLMDEIPIYGPAQ